RVSRPKTSRLFSAPRTPRSAARFQGTSSALEAVLDCFVGDEQVERAESWDFWQTTCSSNSRVSTQMGGAGIQGLTSNPSMFEQPPASPCFLQRLLTTSYTPRKVFQTHPCAQVRYSGRPRTQCF